MDAGDGVSYTQTGETSDEAKIRVSANRTRIVELARNGTKAIADGNYLAGYGDAALTGKETPWTSRCQ